MQASPSSNAGPGRTLLHSLLSCSEGGQLRRCRSQNAWFSAMTGCESNGLSGVGEAIWWAHGSMPTVSSKALEAQEVLVMDGPRLYRQQVPEQLVSRGVELGRSGRVCKHALLAEGQETNRGGSSMRSARRQQQPLAEVQQPMMPLALYAHRIYRHRSRLKVAPLRCCRQTADTGLGGPHLISQGGQAKASNSSNQCLSNW